MKIQPFFDKGTSTLSYVVYDPETKDAVVIDPVLDFDPASGELYDQSAKSILSFINEYALVVHYILETHVHADHLTSSQLIKQKIPHAKIGISHRIKIVQEEFKKVFNWDDFQTDGSHFDILLADEESITAGSIKILAMPTPGHTPACTSFLIGNNLFTGDALFMPDYGTGRCDFPQGSAAELFESITRLYRLPGDTNVFVGHDYQPNGREVLFQTTIKKSKDENIQLNDKTTKDEFIEFREKRDKTLNSPRLLYPSIQINISAGQLPFPETNGVSYIKLPLRPKFTI
jgi:glyoxylase-like metal-dependent hydrolase (beta-lactamase superfamily II)